VRIVATTSALLASGLLGCSTPSDREFSRITQVRVCRSVGYTTTQPCAYLDRGLLLLWVENPASPNAHGEETFRATISRDAANKVFSGVMGTIRSFGNAPGGGGLDGTAYSISIVTSAGTADVSLDEDVPDNHSNLLRLNRLLHEITHGAF
jgi:hypothetical protein